MASPTPEHTTEVTARLKLSPEALAKLKERANGHSLDEFLPGYLTTLVEAELSRPPLDELLAPVRKAFEESGTSEDELVSELEKAKHEARAERHRRARS